MKRHDLKSGAVAKARNLRQAATPEERILWQTLRRYMPAAKFRRQVPMGPYFADFISHGAKLVIELDGAQHAEQQDYDAGRTRFLEREGYRVLRFWNRDIKENFDGVFRAIEAAIAETTSPLVGEGGPKDRMRGAQRSCAPASGWHPSPCDAAARPGDEWTVASSPTRGEDAPLTPCPLPQGEREGLSKSSISESA